MTTPPCPRCGAPLCNGTQLWVYCATCSYGHDEPRALIPQPDALPLPQADAAISETTKRVAAAIYEGYDPKRNWYHTADLAIFALVKLGWGPQPAPTPQRTDAGGVAPLSGLQVAQRWDDSLARHGYAKNEQPAPAANATSAGVDEGMRERVLAVLRKDMPGEYSRMVRLSDDICAAILASHEIVRRPHV